MLSSPTRARWTTVESVASLRRKLEEEIGSTADDDVKKVLRQEIGKKLLDTYVEAAGMQADMFGAMPGLGEGAVDAAAKSPDLRIASKIQRAIMRYEDRETGTGLTEHPPFVAFSGGGTKEITVGDVKVSWAAATVAKFEIVDAR